MHFFFYSVITMPMTDICFPKTVKKNFDFHVSYSMWSVLWERNNIKQVAEKGELKCIYRSQGMWYIFHLIYLVSHISPNARISKHSMIHRFAHCSRCMIRSQKTENAINKTWRKVNYGLPFRVTLLFMAHYNESFLTCVRDWQSFYKLSILPSFPCVISACSTLGKWLSINFM